MGFSSSWLMPLSYSVFSSSSKQPKWNSAHASTLESVIVDEFVKTNVYEGDVSTDILSAD